MHKQCLVAIHHNILFLKFSHKSTIKSFSKQNNRPVFLYESRNPVIKEKNKYFYNFNLLAELK